ncbi:MAG: hypothetical protein IH996_05300 [Proteobacteria bacterium]|nr:hypothetical protein [Pseudomonadota bacterium]
MDTLLSFSRKLRGGRYHIRNWAKVPDFTSPSAFIAFFERSTGSPPGRYFRQG